MNNSSEPDSNNHNIRISMINHLLTLKDLHIKSQQLDEPELTELEKRNVLEEILTKSPKEFIFRFHNYLLPQHIPYFESTNESGSYEIKFYLDKINKNNEKHAYINTIIKNRRYMAMKKLIAEGEYFSVCEMRKRNPLLFEQLLGNFLKNPQSDVDEHQYRVAHILLDQFEQDQVAILKQNQLDSELKEASNYESDSDGDDTFKSQSSSTVCCSTNAEPMNQNLWGTYYKIEPAVGHKRWKEKKNKNNNKRSVLTSDEKMLLINEFTSSMFNSFLQGKDDFNYSEIDNNYEYDDLDQCEIDEQEKYFESESPEETDNDYQHQELSDEDDDLNKFMREMNNQTIINNSTVSLPNRNC